MNHLQNWSLDLLHLFEIVVNQILGIVENMLTTPLNVFAPTAYNLSQALATSITGLGTGIFILLWMIDILSETITFKIKNWEDAIKHFVILIFGLGLISSSFFLLTQMFNILQWVMNAVQQAGTDIFGTDQLSFSYFVAQTREFVEYHNGLMESILLFLVVLMFLLATFGTMLSILLVPIAIFIQLYMYSAFAPIPMATLLTSQKQVGIQFLKTYAGVAIQGALVIFGLMLAQAFLSSPILSFGDSFALESFARILLPILHLMFNMMVLSKCIKSAGEFGKAITGG